MLRGNVPVQLREAVAAPRTRTSKRATQPNAAAASLGPDAQVRFINLKAWRAEVAREHNLPAYVIDRAGAVAGAQARAAAGHAQGAGQRGPLMGVLAGDGPAASGHNARHARSLETQCHCGGHH